MTSRFACRTGTIGNEGERGAVGERWEVVNYRCQYDYYQVWSRRNDERWVMVVITFNGLLLLYDKKDSKRRGDMTALPATSSLFPPVSRILQTGWALPAEANTEQHADARQSEEVHPAYVAPVYGVPVPPLQECAREAQRQHRVEVADVCYK